MLRKIEHQHVLETDKQNDTACEEECNDRAKEESSLLLDIFPIEIELVYEPTQCSQTHFRITQRTWQSHGFAGSTKKPTSFFDLPHELRDETYRYALPPGEVCKMPFALNKKSHRVRSRPKSVPVLGVLVPMLRDEILRAYYKQNTFQLQDFDAYWLLRHFDWIRQVPQNLVRNIRRLQIRHCLSGEYNPPYFWLIGTWTTVTLQSSGHIVVSTTHERSNDGCLCTLTELVQERLFRPDGLADATCVQRIEESTEYGPLFGFALQLFESIRLGKEHRRPIFALPIKEWRKKCQAQELPADCSICGKRKWTFHW